MQEKLVFENSKGDKLAGILSDPEKEKSGLVVIACHGYTSSKNNRTILALEERLKRERISIFRFDFYGEGESEGKLEDLTVEEMVDDIKKAHDFLLKKGYSRFGLFGSSFAGVAAPIALRELGDFTVMALKSPGMGKSTRNMLLFKEVFEKGTWFEAGKYIDVPTMIVHGGADTDVELELGKKLADSIRNSRLEIINGADHGYSKPEDFEKMVDLISNFIIENSKN